MGYNVYNIISSIILINFGYINGQQQSIQTQGELNKYLFYLF